MVSPAYKNNLKTCLFPFCGISIAYVMTAAAIRAVCKMPIHIDNTIYEAA